MPIVISRRSGKTVSGTELTQEQKDVLWGAIVTSYVKKHPEIFEENERKNSHENKL